MKWNKTVLVLLTVCVCWSVAQYAIAEDAQILVQADKPGIKVSPLLYGIFFEEIQRAGDGGIYAEMVQNRSFEDADQPQAWTLVKGGETAEGAMALDSSRPLNAKNPHALRVDIAKAGGGRIGVANEGFKGIALQKNAQYLLSLYSRCDDKFKGPICVSLEKADGTVLAQEKIQGIGEDWKKFDCVLTANATESNATFVIWSTAPGIVWLDMVSLFPKDTFKGRPNGLRKDLAQMLVDLKPAFLRFPGGCFVEGDKIVNATRWKETIGDVALRPGHWNLWGYRSTDGLGFHEYLQMCEDLHAEPLFVINCGMSHKGIVPMDQMGEWVQDALDAIEYSNGPIDSKWGAMRAKAGHPAPFNLKYLQIGNENGGPRYNERYALFYDAIKSRYPQIHLVGTPTGDVSKSRPVEIFDEHFYNDPDFFMSQTGRYDKYDRKGAKIFVGEYAAVRLCGEGNLLAALSEAAFMTGMERNGDIVVMSSYAPLLCNPGWKRWNPNAILFDNSRIYGTPSYYVQAMFAANRGDVVCPVEVKSPVLPPLVRSGLIGVGTLRTQAEFKDIQVTKDGKTLLQSDFARSMKGWKTDGGKWQEGFSDIVNLEIFDWKAIGGDWHVRDGVLCQSGHEEVARIFAGGKTWRDYTYSLKARKTSGENGFLIVFQAGALRQTVWWNVGGWGNKGHGIEADGMIQGEKVPGTIETDRWYDIRIELKGANICCYLDGKLIHDVIRKLRNPLSSLYAVASRENSTGDMILKVVNASASPLDTTVNLRGVQKVAPMANAIVLASASPEDENSFPEPRKVVPEEKSVQNVAPIFRHTFPGSSVTILRVKASQ